MPEGYPIRNKNIEDAHCVIPSAVTTRKMTPEDWVKYGPKSDMARNSNKLPGRPIMKKTKISYEEMLELAKKHGLDKEGREKISQELGVTRVDVTNYICRPYVKKGLMEAGLLPAASGAKPAAATEKTTPTKKKNSKEQLLDDISKQLNVSAKPDKPAKSIEPSKTMIPSVKLHLNLCGNLHETYIAKNTAYGDSFSITFQEFGIISALTRMSDKWNRIKALANGARNDVKDESLEDSLMDLANYCVMTVMELMELKGDIKS